jgi:DNA-binding GntR family transcriptional regulator
VRAVDPERSIARIEKIGGSDLPKIGRPRKTAKLPTEDAVADNPLELTVVPRQIGRRLRADIILGVMAPNTRVVEEDLAERFGVSRSPVREALRLLELDGLIVREDRKGSRVSPVSRRDLDEVYRCRIPLEGIAASEAARNWSVPSMGALMDEYNALEKAYQTGNTETYFDANVVFSEAIHKTSGNSTLVRLLSGIAVQSQRYRFIAYREVPNLVTQSIEGNRELMRLIKERDSIGAKELTEELIQKSWMAIRDVITVPV